MSAAGAWRGDPDGPAPVMAELAELRREVRACAADACRRASLLEDAADHRARLRRVLEGWIWHACARQKVVCFACAAEYRLVLDTRTEEMCRAAARESSALRALFWAAMRRTSGMRVRAVAH